MPQLSELRDTRSIDVLPRGTANRSTPAWPRRTIEESCERGGAAGQAFRPETHRVGPLSPRFRKVGAVDVWVIWLIIAVVLGVAEIFTLTAALGLLGGAAVIASVFAAIGLATPLQFLVFAIAAVTGLVVLRPIAARYRLQPRLERFGVDALVGRTAYVVQEVTGRHGTVRIGGEEWTARTFDQSLVIPTGATVDVIQIDGATAVVYPRE